MNNVRANLFHLLIIRWAALVNIVLLIIFGIDKESLFLFTAVILYCLVLTVFWRRATTLIKRYPLLILIDLTVSGILVALTGGSWASPYYLYSLASLLTASFFLHINGVLAAAGYFSILYTIGLFSNEKTLSNIVRLQDFDILLTSYIAFFIIAIFFGYPAHIIRQIDKAEEDTAIVEDSLRDTKELIKEVIDPNALSCRELVVLTSLSEGKTNAQIAEELHISEKTVKSHLYRIYKKLGIHTREEAIIYYHDNRTRNHDIEPVTKNE